MSGIERIGGGGGELGRGGGGKGGGEGPGGIRKGPIEKMSVLPEDWSPEAIEGGWNFPAKKVPNQELVILTTFEVENTLETIVSSPGVGEEIGKCDEKAKEEALKEEKEKKAVKEKEAEGAAPQSAPTVPAPSPKPVVPPAPAASSTPPAALHPPPLPLPPPPLPPLPFPARGASAPATTTTTRATSSRKFQVDAEDVIAVFQGCCAAYALYLLGDGRVGEDAAVKLVLGLIGGTAAVEWAKAFRSRGKKRVRVVEE